MLLWLALRKGKKSKLACGLILPNRLSDLSSRRFRLHWENGDKTRRWCCVKARETSLLVVSFCLMGFPMDVPVGRLAEVLRLDGWGDGTWLVMGPNGFRDGFPARVFALSGGVQEPSRWELAPISFAIGFSMGFLADFVPCQGGKGGVRR